MAKDKRYNQIMDTKTQLNESVKDAMKTGDEVRKRTVRMVLAAVKQTLAMEPVFLYKYRMSFSLMNA